MKTQIATLLLIQSVILLVITKAYCCGFPFPRQVLLEGDAGLLTPPAIHFEKQLLHLATDTVPPFPPALSNEYSSRERTDQTDIEEFTRAVNATNIAESRKLLLANNYIEIRKLLAESQYKPLDDEAKAHAVDWLTKQFNTSPPMLRQFFGYLKGAVYYRSDEIEEARLHWRFVLLLPEEQRQQRSVWASYMIARSMHDDQPDEALQWYHRADELIHSGFSDSLNLLRNSYGMAGINSLECGPVSICF
jgi:hypothetical protein